MGDIRKHVFFTFWQNGGGKQHSLSNILYQREFYLLKLILKHYEGCSSIKYWHRTVPKCPWHKEQCCTSTESRMRPLTLSTDIRSMIWDSNSTQIEEKEIQGTKKTYWHLSGLACPAPNQCFPDGRGRLRWLGRIGECFAND